MPNPKPRDLPYVHVSYLCKLLAGEASCEWAAWFKSQYSYDKRPSSNTYQGSDSQLKHTKMRNDQRHELEDDGYIVTVEDQNQFHWKGDTAKLAGRPDLIAIRENECLVTDVKSGMPLNSHEVQLLIYMWAIPRALPQYKHKKIRGLLVYESEHRFLEADRLTKPFINDLASLIRRLADKETSCAKTPSSRECKFCQINEKDCPERYIPKPEGELEVVDNEFF